MEDEGEYNGYGGAAHTLLTVIFSALLGFCVCELFRKYWKFPQ